MSMGKYFNYIHDYNKFTSYTQYMQNVGTGRMFSVKEDIKNMLGLEKFTMQRIKNKNSKIKPPGTRLHYHIIRTYVYISVHYANTTL